jgi:flagellar biosynthetic protein FliQ
MEPQALADVGRAAFMTFLRAGLPVMLAGLVVGFAISLLQALTQIQEQTLVYVPKIVAVLGALLLLLPFMGEALGSFMGEIARLVATGGG